MTDTAQLAELHVAVDAAFSETSRGLRMWDDPHHGEAPRDEEYSRCLDPAKWRIIGARADAWSATLIDRGLARLDRDVDVAWPADHVPTITRTDVFRPLIVGALGLAVGRSAIGSVDDAGVAIGVVGDDGAVEVVGFLPDCGCDACDSGSQAELDQVDQQIGSVVSGAFRRLVRRASSITVVLDGWSAQNLPRPRRSRGGDEVERILADPRGWEELRGSPWWPVPGS